jgi:hypothetical protein
VDSIFVAEKSASNSTTLGTGCSDDENSGRGHDEIKVIRLER